MDNVTLRTPASETAVFLDLQGNVLDVQLLHDAWGRTKGQQVVSAARAGRQLMVVAAAVDRFGRKEGPLVVRMSRLSARGTWGIGGAGRLDKVGGRRFGGGGGVLVLGRQLRLELGDRGLEVLNLLLQGLQLLLQDQALRTGSRCCFTHGPLP